MKKQIPNTFQLAVYARDVVIVNTTEQLFECYTYANSNHMPVLILGQGSNTFFTTDFEGIIIINRIKGITVKEDNDFWLIKVGAGEIWHQLVEYTLENDMPGLENLALIPGCVGSAPIQNIGAYGVEFGQYADYVELLDLSNGKIITVKEGEYRYRDSIFKSTYRHHYAVIYVGIKLPKKWIPVLEYGELKSFSSKTVTPKMVFNKVCEIRRQKLPDPNILGNGGSFFMNPIIEQERYQQLIQSYPNMPAYLQSDGKVKVAAGWLIDQCGLKGYQLGGAAVHAQQALVLINNDNAATQDVLELAAFVQRTVQQKFAISLVSEIRFIGSTGEIDPMTLLSQH